MRTETIIVLKEPKKKYYSMAALTETLLGLVLFVGMALALQDLYPYWFCLAVFLGNGIAVTATLHVATVWKHAQQRVQRIWQLAAAVMFLAGFSWISQGFLACLNQFFYLCNYRFGTEFLIYSVNGRAVIGSALLWGLLAEELALLLSAQIHRKRIWSLTVLVLLMFGFGCIFRSGMMWPALICMFPALLGYFCYDSGVHRMPGKTDFYLVAGCLICFAVTGIAAVYSNAGIQVERWKETWSEKIEAFRYGSDTLPQGDFKKASQLLDGEEERLEVTMEEPKELYLKGFVGGIYENNRWEVLPFTDYQDDYAGMLKWLEKQDFLPVSQVALYERLTEEGRRAEQSVEVQNTGAYRKYVYLPATVSSWSLTGSKAQKDRNVTAETFLGAYHYQFRMTGELTTAEKMVPANWLMQPLNDRMNTYLDAESVYRSFAENFYTEIDPDTEKQVTGLFFPDGVDKLSFQEITVQIRQILRSEMEYTKTPGTYSENQDLLTWFLEEKHGGNAVAYATAAVMAYRAAGYPARYVEGYHLSEADAASMQEEGRTTAILTTQNAHAWAEVYMAGVGWMPVEVVPGFYQETYTNETVEGKPAYQIHALPDKNGPDIVDQAGSVQDEALSQEKETKKMPIQYVAEWCILAGYILVAMYLMLELQRALRIRAVKRRRTSLDGLDYVDEMIKETEKLMHIAGVTGDYAQTQELWIQMKQAFPGIEKEEYQRVIELMQRIRFGQKQWTLSEQRTVLCYVRHLEKCLYRKRKPIGRLILRYYYAI